MTNLERLAINHGYCRCSTNESKQDIQRQVRELEANGATNICFEYEHGDAEHKAELERLKNIKDAIGKEAWMYYKDYKNPMKNSKGNDVKYASDEVRKAIEDAMGDLLGARNNMTDAQLEKEDAQIQGGRKQEKARKAAESK